jgi:hypothetical protein
MGGGVSKVQRARVRPRPFPCRIGALVALGLVALGVAPLRPANAARAPHVSELRVLAGLPAPDLYPGSDDGDLVVLVENTGSDAVVIHRVDAGAVTSDSPDACDADNVTVRPADGLHHVVAPHASEQRIVVPDVVAMRSSAPDGCQGVTFTVAVRVEAEPA